PCKFQMDAARAFLQRKHVTLIAPMGAGKTLAFWIPLLFNNIDTIIVVTALNILGEKRTSLDLYHNIPTVKRLEK
ncbi:hypothetical protein M422DRAFT_162857, partial [Sphaerobolus stellatus SS14]